MQKWLTRPVYALRVEPGERGAYEEAQGSQAAAPPASARVTTASPSRASSRWRRSPFVRRPGRAARRRSPPTRPMPEVGEIADLDFPDIERATPLERHPDRLCPPRRRAGHPGRGRVQRRHRRRSRPTRSAPRR